MYMKDVGVPFVTTTGCWNQAWEVKEEKWPVYNQFPEDVNPIR